jgi:peptidoglycan hydrolase CwlO-like protein
MPNEEIEEIEEIDVTELTTKVEKLEQENFENKTKIAECESDIQKLAQSLGELADLIGQR